MTALLTDNLPLLACAPNGIKKLRELILELAVRGKLVPQDPRDEPASQLLTRIAEEKTRLVAEGKGKKQKPLAEVGEKVEAFELPAGWKWSSLGQAAFVNPRNSAADSLEVSFVPMTFIGTRFDDQHGQEPRLWSEVKQGFTHFAEDDIGVAKITPCFENSKACVFSDLVNGLGAGTTELHIVRPVTGTLDPRYVLAYLKSPQFLHVGETKMTGTAGQKRLPKDFVEANPFPLPPLAEQHRIVAKVDELMALCDRLEAQQADAKSAHAQLVQALLDSLTQTSDATEFAINWQRLAEHFHTLFTTEPSIDALKQTLLQLAVMGKLVPQDQDDEPASKLLDIISEGKKLSVPLTKNNRQGSESTTSSADINMHMPAGWAVARLEAITTSLNQGLNTAAEKTAYVDQGYKILQSKHITSGEIFAADARFVNETDFERNKTRCQPGVGDILFTNIGTIGKSLIVPTSGEEFLVAWNIFIIRPSKLICSEYLKFSLDALDAKGFFQSLTSGSATKFVSKSAMSSTLISIPPAEEQLRIVAKVDQLMALCDQLKSCLTQARQLNEQLAVTFFEQAVA